jgi:hypothetical protein
MSDDPIAPNGSAEPGAGAEPAPLSLLYLDVDDEITSAAARIRAAAATEVVLVLPYGSRLATSRINFRLLAREAAARGKTIQIVCADASARSLAAAAGLPVHASVAAFEAHRTGVEPAGGDMGATAGNATALDVAATAATVAGATALDVAAVPLEADDTKTRVLATPRRKSPAVPRVGPPRPPIRTRLAIAGGLAVVASLVIGVVLALEFLPSATITLHPRSEPLGPLELTVEAREDVTEPDAAAMVIPAQRFTFPVEASQTFPATGVRVEEAKATGSVTFSNFDTGGGVLIPRGTIVETDDDVAFRTIAEVTLPRAQIDFFPPFPVQPSNETVGVEAVEAGPEGNVGNNTIVNVNRGGRNLRVTNAEATVGGARDELPEVSADDVEAAKAALTAALIAELDRQVVAGVGIPEAITLFPETRSVGAPEYSVDPDTLAGTAGSEFSLGATAEGSALGVDTAPIQALAATRIGATVTDDWAIALDSVTADIGTAAVLGTTIVYPITIDATQVRGVDRDALLGTVLGLGIPEARAVLDDFGDVDIDVWPDWVTKIPTRDDRVTFDLAEPQPSAPPS